MNQLTHEQQQRLYNQEILRKENQKDELINEKRKIENAIFELESDLRLGFQQVTVLNDELFKQGNSMNFRKMQRGEEYLQAFRQQLRASEEQFELAYRKEINRLDDEREALYKKRSEIPWD
ncbi:hypothetical protein GIX45_25145 [Erwinia sp. CPCC 100877]|nr:hypothetical protein [Erwinia sp. CPCC 100877]